MFVNFSFGYLCCDQFFMFGCVDVIKIGLCSGWVGDVEMYFGGVSIEQYFFDFVGGGFMYD